MIRIDVVCARAYIFAKKGSVGPVNLGAIGPTGNQNVPMYVRFTTSVLLLYLSSQEEEMTMSEVAPHPILLGRNLIRSPNYSHRCSLLVTHIDTDDGCMYVGV